MEPIKMTHMPALICGRGAVKFAATLGRKRAAVIGYTDSVEEKAREIFAGTDTEIRYIASIQREPLIGDIFDNLPALQEFQPDLILAIGGGSVMDVAKGLHLFYENPHLSFADSLKPFALPALGKKAVSVHVPTTSGTGSETSSAAVCIHPETKVKNLLLSNTLIPQYAVVDADFTDHLPPAIQIVSGLDAMCHAIESTTAANSNVFTKAIATQAALDVLDYLPDAVNMDLPEAQRLAAKEKLHMAATMAGIAITNSFTGIVHSYDHPGPAFHLPHGVVCGIMLPYAMELVGPQEEYACLARRLGYRGDRTALWQQLISHIRNLNHRLGLSDTFAGAGVDEKAYFQQVPTWADLPGRHCHQAIPCQHGSGKGKTLLYPLLLRPRLKPAPLGDAARSVPCGRRDDPPGGRRRLAAGGP
ncbi:MAG: iron-containing alcohol dehydrogenase, partial [Christensenellales bacterium]|nr:iron-containing alcohol dehydrogenase [Christensenellales bacterium]